MIRHLVPCLLLACAAEPTLAPAPEPTAPVSTAPEPAACGDLALPPVTPCRSVDDCAAGATCVDERCVVDAQGDVLDDAIPLTSGNGVGVIWPEGDVDWWTLEVDAPGFVSTALLSGDDPDADLVFTWVDPDLVPWVALVAPIGDDLLVHRAGTWRVAVSDAGGGGDEDFDYAFSACADGGLVTAEDTEPIVVEEPAPVGVVFESAEDVDEIVIDVVDDTAALVLQLDAQYLDVSASTVELVAPTGEVVASSAGVCAGCEVRYPFGGPGAWTARVSAHGVAGGAVWSVGSEDAGAIGLESEPNDTLAEASTVYAGQDGLGGHLQEPGDLDSYHFTSTDEGMYSVDCAAPGADVGELWVTITDAAGAVLAEGAWSASAWTVEPRIRIEGDNSGAMAWYACTLRRPSTPGTSSCD